jgi:hypothetical protein
LWGAVGALVCIGGISLLDIRRQHRESGHDDLLSLLRMKLHLSPDLALPLALVTESLSILAIA